MQDEPERRPRFQRRMSLKGWGGDMLGIDRQHGSRRADEPGTDPGISERVGGIRFEGKSRPEIYEWVTQTLRQQGYERLGRAAKGLIRAYIGRVTGLSRAQVTRPLRCFSEQRGVQAHVYRGHGVARRQTRAALG